LGYFQDSTDEQFPGVVLKALFGYRQYLYVVQAVGYVVFLVTVGGLYFRSIMGAGSGSAKNQPVAQKSIGSVKD
jgi:high-affinity iron transporter